MTITLHLPGGPCTINLADGVGIHIPLVFARPEEADGQSAAVQPSTYGMPPATARPYRDGEWVGDTRAGGSCNFEALTLVPHCNGTHTETIGHLTLDRVSIHDRHTQLFIPGMVVDVKPEITAQSTETSDPAPASSDKLITARALQAALAHQPDVWCEAVVIRTLPNPASKTTQAYDTANPPPYLTQEAAKYLVQRGTKHLLVDVPSIDRLLDAGRLTAHRVFFGLPPVSQASARSLAAATRPNVTVTELVYVPQEVAAGRVIVHIQVPPFVTDAAPSRVFLYVPS